MTRPLNGPELWDILLRDIRRANGGLDPIIAGGAVRDFILGGEVKDIDIWFQTSRDRTLKPSMISAAKWMRMPIKEEDATYDHNRALKSIQNFKVHGYEVQLIGVEINPWNWLNLVNDFNIGLSKMAYTGDGTLHLAADAITDIANKTVTVVKPNAGERLKRCVDKATALAKKYGYDATNIIPAAMMVEPELEDLPF